jgi:hypothetical protein
VESRRLTLNPKQCWLANATLVLVLGASCSSALGQRPKGDDDTDLLDTPGSSKVRFPNQDLAAKHKAAKASPQKFDPVFDYARTVSVFCLGSLVDTTCASCDDGQVKYKPRSDLNPHYWPIIEDVLSMLDPLMQVKELDAVQMEQLVTAKGRLLWLAGRSSEEENLIDLYAHAHPDAVAVVKRRLELLREERDVVSSESQCTRSRARMKSAPEAARLELLTSCVALHPANSGGKSDPPDYKKYLPNPAPDEESLYRTHLVQRCVEDLGDQDAPCTEACACTDNASDKQSTATCKRTCQDCRSTTEQQIRACKALGTPAPAPAAARARTPRPKAAPVSRPQIAPAPRPKTAPASQPKVVDPNTGPQQAVL